MSVVLGYKFAAIPEWVLYHPKLTGDDVRVFGVLARYGNDIRPSLATIAVRIGKSEQSARRCVHRLARVGALWVEERFQEGAQLPNRYHLAADEPLTGDRGGSTSGRGVGSPVVPEREQDNEIPSPTETADAEARSIATRHWERVEAETGKKPVGIRYMALVKLLCPFLKVGWTVEQVEGAVGKVRAERRAMTRQVIEEYLDGRAATATVVRPDWKERAKQRSAARRAGGQT